MCYNKHIVTQTGVHNGPQTDSKNPRRDGACNAVAYASIHDAYGSQASAHTSSVNCGTVLHSEGSEGSIGATEHGTGQCSYS